MVQSRDIFEYHDGEKIRYGDPFAIWRGLTQDPVINLERISPDVDAGKEPETSQFLDLIRRVFGVTKFDEATGTGLTDWQTLALVNHLRSYTKVVKKNSNSGRTSPESTEPKSSNGPEPQNEITNASGDSTSTPAASEPEKPTT
jgi:hypothetical protein